MKLLKQNLKSASAESKSDFQEVAAPVYAIMIRIGRMEVIPDLNVGITAAPALDPHEIQRNSDLLMAPGADFGEFCPIPVRSDGADLGSLAGQRKPPAPADFEHQMQRLIRIPRIPVVVTEEIMSVIGCDPPPVVN